MSNETILIKGGHRECKPKDGNEWLEKDHGFRFEKERGP